MSFARPRLFLGISPRLFTKYNSPSLRSHRRLLSTEGDPVPDDLDDGLTSGIDARRPHHLVTPRIFDANGKELDAYKGGPSAIEKAVHFFFITEIFSGETTLPFTYKNLTVRSQGCGS